MMEDVKQGWKIQGSQPVSSHSHGKLTVAQKQIISVILSLISLALVLVLVFAVAVPRYGYHRAFGQITRAYMLMYGKEASNRKQEIDRQHYTIPNQRPKDKHCGKI